MEHGLIQTTHEPGQAATGTVPVEAWLQRWGLTREDALLLLNAAQVVLLLLVLAND